MSILMRIQHGSSWNDKNKIYADNTNGMWKANGRYLISFKKTSELFSLTEQKMKHLSWDVNVEYLRWYNKRWKIVEWNLKRIVVDIFKFSRSLLCSIWSCFLVFFFIAQFPRGKILRVFIFASIPFMFRVEILLLLFWISYCYEQRTEAWYEMFRKNSQLFTTHYSSIDIP